MLTTLLLTLLPGVLAQDLLVPEFGFVSLDQVDVAFKVTEELHRSLKAEGLYPVSGANLPPQAADLGETCLGKAAASTTRCPAASALLDQSGGRMLVLGYVNVAADGRSLEVSLRAYAWSEPNFPAVDVQFPLLPGEEAQLAQTLARAVRRGYQNVPARPVAQTPTTGTPTTGTPTTGTPTTGTPTTGTPTTGTPTTGTPTTGTPTTGTPTTGTPTTGTPTTGTPTTGTPTTGVLVAVPTPGVEPKPSCLNTAEERERLGLSEALYAQYCSAGTTAADWVQARRVRTGLWGLELQAGLPVFWMAPVSGVHTAVDPTTDLGAFNDGFVDYGTHRVDQVYWSDFQSWSRAELADPQGSGPGELVVDGSAQGYRAPVVLGGALTFQPSARWELGLRGGALLTQRWILLTTTALNASAPPVHEAYRYALSSAVVQIEPRARWSPRATGVVKPYVLGAVTVSLVPELRYKERLPAWSGGEEGLCVEDASAEGEGGAADEGSSGRPTWDFAGSTCPVPYNDTGTNVMVAATGGAGVAVDLTRKVSLFVEVPVGVRLPLGPLSGERARASNCTGTGGDGCFGDQDLSSSDPAGHLLPPEVQDALYTTEDRPYTLTVQSGLQLRF